MKSSCETKKIVYHRPIRFHRQKRNLKCHPLGMKEVRISHLPDLFTVSDTFKDRQWPYQNK